MKKLIHEALKQYQETLELDKENTDSLFFICEELGENLSVAKFDLFCQRVENELKMKGMN